MVSGQQNEINLLIKYFYDRTGLVKTEKDIKKLGFSVGQGGQVWDDVNKKVSSHSKAIGAINKQTHKFQMGWLSVMFATMKVKKLMTNLFKDMMATFKKVAGKGHPLNLAMTRLNASFTYLKFSIVSAMGPMLDRFVLWLANMAISIAEMPEGQLRAIGAALVIFTGLAFVVGFVAEVALLVNGLKDLALNGPKILNVLQGLTGPKGLKGLTAIGGGFIAAHFILRAVSMLSEDGTTIVDDLIGIGEGALAGAMIGYIFGPIGAAIGAGIGAAISLTISLVDIFFELKKEFGDDMWSELFKKLAPSGWKLFLPGGKFMFIGDIFVKARALLQKPDVVETEGIEDIIDPVKTLSEFTTPDIVLGLQKLWDENIIQSLAGAITGDGGLVPALDSANLAVGRVQTATDALQDDWDSWVPKEKTYTIKIKEIKEGGGSSSDLAGLVGTGATTSYGTPP